jgi:hypothetical protein
MTPGLLSVLGVPESEINSQIRLSAPEGWNNYKSGDAITLLIEVIGKNQVIFPNDYGARVFIPSNHEWVEVKNSMRYPDNKYLLSFSNDRTKHGSTSVLPVLPDLNKSTTVRIFIIGNIYRDGKVTEERTAGFIDVDLRP